MLRVHLVMERSWKVMELQRAKKVVCDSPRLVDFVIGLVNLF